MIFMHSESGEIVEHYAELGGCHYFRTGAGRVGTTNLCDLVFIGWL